MEDKVTISIDFNNDPPLLIVPVPKRYRLRDTQDNFRQKEGISLEIPLQNLKDLYAQISDYLDSHDS